MKAAIKKELAPIVWTNQYDFQNKVIGWNGHIKGKLMFIIDIKGKRNPKYVLKSYPFESGIFTKANNYKKLFEDTSLSLVSEKADIYVQQFVNFFLKGI